MAFTKDDIKILQGMFEKNNEKLMENINAKFNTQEAKFDAKIDALRYDLDSRLTTIEERIKYIPTSDEHFNMMDTFIKQIETTDMEKVALGSKVDRNEKRIDVLEIKAGIKTGND